MTFDFGLADDICFPRKFRWLLKIPDISADGIGSLPPQKSARPSLAFKEASAEHLNETIYFPMKPDWKPINLTLYDLKKTTNPIFKWLKSLYNPCNGNWLPPSASAFGSSQSITNTFKKSSARLEMYDGCGKILETWVYENVYPNNIEWGELDMSNVEVTTVDLTLRYDRAYIEDECQ